MLELKARPFLGAVTQLSRLITALNAVSNDNVAEISPAERAIFLPSVEEMTKALEQVRARSALASAQRLKERLEDTNCSTKINEVKIALSDIESRFADHLLDIKLFVMSESEAALLQPADNLLAFAGKPVTGYSLAFPNASFEIEEAAKCIAMERHTAAVFHCMRAVECGIKALASLLDVPDPTKAAEKNWGIILGNIKDAIDKSWPRASRLPNSDGAKMELLYSQLDAIKNPWRNATMHVETIYAPHEAIHITRCTGMFMLELMKYCAEQGITLSTAPAMATVGSAASSDSIEP